MGVTNIGTGCMGQGLATRHLAGCLRATLLDRLEAHRPEEPRMPTINTAGGSK